MSLPKEEEQVKLTFQGTTSHAGTCPTLYSTDQGTYVVQGYKVTDPEALAALRERGLPDHETAVEVPAALLDVFVPKAAP
ncbi:hypothetical protein SAMN05421805_1011477 [Saccharopolyspora antimicrobica]|uniref:Uncharacterized protein n=1 Tax=Saccharopolyspora antimicrobica TaxID=455193 RepID=A0A1I4TLB0_9PSEU|nr:hypothetical protein ATL45_6891 [Saccharopolyspora antimicrobica]SFM77411.1 hypothetical protein SAMN05421805_1011477 [Saccharopolyspora antimicrobica]